MKKNLQASLPGRVGALDHVNGTQIQILLQRHKYNSVLVFWHIHPRGSENGIAEAFATDPGGSHVDLTFGTWEELAMGILENISTSGDLPIIPLRVPVGGCSLACYRLRSWQWPALLRL